MSKIFKVVIAKDKCKGCNLCVAVCPMKKLTVSNDLNKKGMKYVQVKDNPECSGCGLCFLVCPDCCIEIYSDDRGQNTENRGQMPDGKK